MYSRLPVWFLAALICSGPAFAQVGGGSTITPAGVSAAAAAGVQGVTGGIPLAISGTITASLGGFTPSASGARMAQLPVTTSDSSGNLPTGAVVVVSDSGATNPMFCNVNGVAATTSDQLIPPQSWFAFTIPATITTLHCIATGGSTTADGLGGAGLATGAGGGGGGGGSSSNASVSATGSAVPASATYFGMLVAGNLTGVPGTANGVKVDGSAVTQPVSGTFWQTTQPISAASLPLPTSASTAANQTVTQGVIGNATAPTDMSVAGLVYDSTPLTLTNGQSSALQGDANGYLNVHIQAGGGSGGTSAADNSAWTAGTTNQTPAGCEYTSGGATALTTAHVGTVGCTAARAQLTDKSSVAGTTLVAAVSAYGTAPTGTDVEGVNAYVTNSNANGSATSANSSPVVIASDQAAVAVKAASGAFASGALASGSIASGAAVSGAFVAGAIADLAHGQGAMAVSVPVAIASNQSVADPCTFQAKTNAAISTASGTAALVTGVSGKKIYVCSLLLIAPSAVSVSLAEGSSATCGTSNQAAVIGVATNGTAANGLPLAANGGLTLGNGGGTVAATATTANYLCLFQSGTAQIAGNLTYVQQ